MKLILRIMPLVGTYTWAGYRRLAMLGQEALSAASLNLSAALQREKVRHQNMQGSTETGSSSQPSPLLVEM